MNKMIDDTLIGKIKKLFKSIWADDKGNVEVGKNLEVDGNAKVNGELSVGDNKVEPEKYSKARYQHTITIAFTSHDEIPVTYKVQILAFLTTNTPINSETDLQTYLGGALFIASGTLGTAEESDVNFVSSLNTHTTTWQDYTLDGLASAGYWTSQKLSSFYNNYTVTYTDDVSIPK